MGEKKLAGGAAWISGGASGMGAATARLFARQGARVAIADVDAARGESLAEDIQAAGGEAIFLPCDVRREAEVRDSIQATVATFGSLRTIVNSAGVVHVRLLHEYDEQEWDDLMAVNLKSVFFSIKHGYAHLKRLRRSYVVNVGSIGSFTGQATTPAYNTSKAAVLQLTRGIALDYAADGLRCNCVCPGITDTPMLRYHLSKAADPEGTLRGRLRRVPIGTVLEPEQISRAILFFSCEDSAGITGTSLVVDGGYLAASEWESPPHTAFMEPDS